MMHRGRFALSVATEVAIRVSTELNKWRTNLGVAIRTVIVCFDVI